MRENKGGREWEREGEGERELCGVCWPWSQSRAELNRALSRVGRQGCQGWGGWGAKVSSLWGILSPLIRSQGPPMADVSFTTGPSSSLFWQGGALCRLHCTNTKLFVQGGKKKFILFFPLSPFHLFIRLAYMCSSLPNPRVHNAEADPSVLRQHKQVGGVSWFGAISW